MPWKWISFAGLRVTRVLDQITAERGLPPAIRCDNGPELTSRHFLAWALERKIDLVHIQPGKPTQNAYVESFNSKLREECLHPVGSRTCSKPEGSSPSGVAITTNGGPRAV